MNIFCVSNQDLDRLEISTYVTNSFDLALERAVDVLNEPAAEHVYVCHAEADFDDVAWDRESLLESMDHWTGQLMLPMPVDQVLKIGKNGVGEWVRKGFS